MNNIKIEIHLIQNFAPSCLNRDDTNTPKDCDFGGVRRARISSQCIKSAIRQQFIEKSEVETGYRTKSLIKPLAEEVVKAGKSQSEAEEAARIFVEAYYSALDDKTAKTKVLLYISQDEIKTGAKLILDDWDEISKIVEKQKELIEKNSEKKPSKDFPELKQTNEIKKQLKDSKLSADIALFGRMLAEHSDLKTDAACQVAHAISTHRVDMDMDFYTAIDDLNTSEETGAGMMGVTGFNSSCFYRYALIDRLQLVNNLGGDADLADKVIRAFLEASVQAIPTGKQNTFAANNLPEYGLATVKKNGLPCSLANAFTKPIVVRSDNEDLVEKSIKTFDNYYKRFKEVYGTCGIVGGDVVFCLPENIISDTKNISDWIDSVMNNIKQAELEG